MTDDRRTYRVQQLGRPQPPCGELKMQLKEAALGRMTILQRLLLLPAAASVLVACSTADVANTEVVRGESAGSQPQHNRRSEAVARSDEQELQANERPSRDHAKAWFPRELTGLWIGSQYPCPLPEVGFDGEEIMEISPDELVGYEEIYKPTEVTLISEAPRIWKIKTLVDIGPSGVFQEYGAITFRLHNGILTTDHKPQIMEFKECRQQ